MDETIKHNVAEWTERPEKRGLDPLGMQTSSIRLYQSLMPGISNVTLRMRYYGLYPWLCRIYAKRIGHTDPARWQNLVRRGEALYALVATRAESNSGVAGVDWAKRTIEKCDTRIDFAADAETGSAPSYLQRAAFQAAYRSQLFETAILTESTEHSIPVPTDLGEELADAFANALGTVADQLYEIIQRGWVSPTDLDDVATSLPSAIPVGGVEATLYTQLLLQADESRGRTVALVLAVARLLEREPTVDHFRWTMYAGSDPAGRPLALGSGVGTHTAEALGSQRDLWWVYQANDLCHVAYEALLKYMLDVLVDQPAGMSPRRLVERCTDGIAAAMDSPPASWAAWIARTVPRQNAWDEDPASDFALAAEVMGAGRNERRHCGPQTALAAVRLLGILHRRLQDEDHNLHAALGGLADPLFRSLLTEHRFLDQRGDDDLRATLFALLEERVLARHLWVAMRKLRYQNDYTFLVEIDDGLVRSRALDGPVYTTPRIGSVLAFLRDCHLVGANGVTQQGLVAMSR